MATGDPYITDEELADYLRMDSAAETEAATHLTLAGTAASRWIESYTGRDFNLAASASARYFDVMSDGTVLVDDIGHETITVATDSAQDGTYSTTWDAADVQALPLGAVTAGQPVTQLVAVGSHTFPTVVRRSGLISVTARWGWPAVPAPVKTAALIQAARLFKRRESAEGVLGGGDFGIVRVGNRIDPDVADLLAPYRFVSVG